MVLKMYGSRLSIRCASTAMYAVPPLKCDGSIFDTAPHDGIPATFFETSFHFAPPSFVYQILPSLVPAQMSPFSTSEVAMAKITSGANCPRLSPTIPPDETMRAGSCFERSGLITCQLCPPFVVLKMTLQP